MVRRYFRDPVFSRFGSTPTCDRQTRGRIDSRTHDHRIPHYHSFKR